MCNDAQLRGFEPADAIFYRENYCMKLLTRLVSFSLLVMISLSIQASAAMVMSPYLQAVTENSVCVMVECDSKDPVTVEYGETTAYSKTAITEVTVATTATPTTYVHRIILKGLKPNSIYHYRARQNALVCSNDYYFQSAVNPGTSFKFAALADFRNGTRIHEEIAERIKAAHPAFSIYGGDVCGNNTYDSFKKEFFQPNELALSSITPFFNVPGNHEGWTANTKAFTQAPQSKGPGQGYYSFDYGDVHFVGINNEVSCSEGSPQWNFVKNDLASTKRRWKIVFFHRPAYCAGGHGEDRAMKEMTTKLFEPNKVNVVIAGHSHFYQHSLVNGIHHFVLGAAGAPLYSPGSASYVVKSAKVQHYAIIDVSPQTLKINVYKQDGTPLDSLELSKTAK